MGSHFSRFLTKIEVFWSREKRNSSAARRLRHSDEHFTSNVSVQIEQLEQRSLLSAANVLTTIVAHTTIQATTPSATSGPTGLTPSQLQTAYGFNGISFANGSNGAGQTIAIVDAYHAPTIQNDLMAFDRAFGLADPPSFTVMSQTGSTTVFPPTDPSTNTTNNWEVEEALDVEWAHALAPGAKIVLVEANSASYADLFAAVRTAANLTGVSVVSMSWGGAEFSSEAAYDSYFTTPAGHQGVTFVASTGDNGAPGGYPAYSPNVLAVGGTTLSVDSSGHYLSESAWSGSGGGISTFEPQPAYQSGFVTQTSTRRAIPDVSFDADPNSGVPVYDTFSFGTSRPWGQIGGTSLSAPAWGAIISIVDQARAQNGLGSLDGATQTLPMLYSLSRSNPSAFHDITTGSNGLPAGAGYDLVTGLGTPAVNILVPGMSGQSTATSHLVFLQSPTTAIAGSVMNPVVKVAIEDQNGQVITTDSSRVTLSIDTGPGGFSSGSTVTVTAVNGIATFSNLTLNVAGTYRLKSIDGNLSTTASSTLTVSPAAASKVVFTQAPSGGTAGQVLNAIVAAIEDQYGNIITNNNSLVTIRTASGPAGFTSTSTTSVTAINGIATFNNLVLSTIGNYTLNISSGVLTSATSATFTIAAATTNPVLTARLISSQSAVLTWTPVSGVQSYRIFYMVGNQKHLLGSVGSNYTSVQVLGLIPGFNYMFQVEAVRGTTVLDSNWVSVNTALFSSRTRA